MAYIESFQCDVCGDKKGEGGDWWLAWVDCFQGEKPEEDQPLIKLTRWQSTHARSANVKHLCGARCAGLRCAMCRHADGPVDDATACGSGCSLRDQLSNKQKVTVCFIDSRVQLALWFYARGIMRFPKVGNSLSLITYC